MKWVKTSEQLPIYDDINHRIEVPIRFIDNHGVYRYLVGIYNEQLGYWQTPMSYRNNQECAFTNIDELTLKVEWLDENYLKSKGELNE